MEFDELPTHIQEQWEQSEQFGDELRMIRTLRAGSMENGHGQKIRVNLPLMQEKK